MNHKNNITVILSDPEIWGIWTAHCRRNRKKIGEEAGHLLQIAILQEIQKNIDSKKEENKNE